jgi:hypothetical protein
MFRPKRAAQQLTLKFTSNNSGNRVANAQDKISSTRLRQKSPDYLMSHHRAKLYNTPITGYGAIVFRGGPPVALTLLQPT